MGYCTINGVSGYDTTLYNVMNVISSLSITPVVKYTNEFFINAIIGNAASGDKINGLTTPVYP